VAYEGVSARARLGSISGAMSELTSDKWIVVGLNSSRDCLSNPASCLHVSCECLIGVGDVMAKIYEEPLCGVHDVGGGAEATGTVCSWVPSVEVIALLYCNDSSTGAITCF
jgi:hypothetical protein